MRVLFLRPQPAIRSLKYVLAFNNVNAGIEPYHAYTAKTLTQLYGYGDECFKKFVRLDSRSLGDDLKQLIKDLSIELIHSQNAPDALTRVAIEVAHEIPIIHENQDAISLRQTPYTPEGRLDEQLVDERIANKMCDARIHVSQGLLDYIRGKYDAKKEIVFHNYVSRSMVPPSCMRKLSDANGEIHIVYEGTLSSFPGDHYDLKEIFKDLAARGYQVHIYDSQGNQDYLRLAEMDDSIHYHGRKDPRQLLYEITQYDYGWAGFNAAKNRDHLDVALPNKLFEYLASGLPVLSFPHRAQKEFLERECVGVVFEDLNGLEEKIKQEATLEQVRSNVLRRRFELTMEANVKSVLDLYTGLVERGETCRE